MRAFAVELKELGEPHNGVPERRWLRVERSDNGHDLACKPWAR